TAGQDTIDAVIAGLVVRFEGVYFTRDQGFPAGAPLVARAAVNALELVGSTLDPGGFRRLDGTRAPIWPAVELRHPHGFADAKDAEAFKETPALNVSHSITGPLLVDAQYGLEISSSIVDAGRGVADGPDDAFAISGATDPVADWGPPTSVTGATF